MIGEAIANYELTGFLGAGSQATVYEARHAILGTTAAIKILLPQFVRDEPDRIPRFLDEARAAARLPAHGIVRVIDCGRDDRTGCLYIVMEKVEGVTLARLLRERTPTIDEAVAILAQLTEALAAAHGHVDETGTAVPIVHRDLKPENILVCAPHDQVKIVDFGLATLGTRTSALAYGSPPYMAPELFVAGRPVDPRSDLYALGCIFCELLTGAPPAPGTGAPPALAGVPADLRAIATKLIAPDPDDRYQSCSALAAALAAHGPSPAAGASAPARAAWSRNGHGPAKAWAIAFFTGWMMLAASVILGVGESYGASVNWGFTYIVVVPLVFAFLVRTLRDAESAVRAFVARGMLIDGAGQPVPDPAPIRAWRRQLEMARLHGGVAIAVSVMASLAEWWVRVHARPVAGQWWVEAPVMGALGAIAQGVLMGGVLWFLTVIIPWTWLVAELGSGRLEVRLRPHGRSGDPRRGFEVVAPVVLDLVVCAALLYLVNYASNLQHIAIELGRRASGPALSLAALFEHGTLYEVGPLHLSSTTVILGCASILVCTTIGVSLLHRAYWAVTGAAHPLLRGCSPAACALAALAALGMFVIYKLGIVVVLAILVAAVITLRRALRLE